MHPVLLILSKIQEGCYHKRALLLILLRQIPAILLLTLGLKQMNCASLLHCETTVFKKRSFRYTSERGKILSRWRRSEVN